jgi:CBS domain-containing protein
MPSRRRHEFDLDEIMSKNLTVLTEEDDLAICAKLMLENKISSIIVTDNNNDDRLKGIITKSDMVDAYAKYYPIKSLVEEYMTKEVITASPDVAAGMPYKLFEPFMIVGSLIVPYLYRRLFHYIFSCQRVFVAVQNIILK